MKSSNLMLCGWMLSESTQSKRNRLRMISLIWDIKKFPKRISNAQKQYKEEQKYWSSVGIFPLV